MYDKSDFEKKALKTLNYFIFFKYPPKIDEIHTFLEIRISKKELQDNLSKSRKIAKITGHRYTPGGYNKDVANYPKRAKLSEQKIRKTRSFIKLLAEFPQIKLIGLSGSVAMMNANKADDVDLFIISSKNRLWTARFLALILASILGKRRLRGERKAEDKVCLNLFFDETNLRAPSHKQSDFVAHEILQMKPIVNKNNVYERFIWANEWVFKIFPNAKAKFRHKINKKMRKTIILGDLVEVLLKKMQLWKINRHKTSEIITDTQLWFFPQDFEKKLNL